MNPPAQAPQLPRGTKLEREEGQPLGAPAAWDHVQLQPRGNRTHSSKEVAQCPELGSNLRLPHCPLSCGSGIDAACAPQGCWEGDAQRTPSSPRARGTSAASEVPAALPDSSAQVHVGHGLRTASPAPHNHTWWLWVGNRPPAGSQGAAPRKPVMGAGQAGLPPFPSTHTFRPTGQEPSPASAVHPPLSPSPHPTCLPTLPGLSLRPAG